MFGKKTLGLLFALLLLLSLVGVNGALASAAWATALAEGSVTQRQAEETSVIRPDCAGYGGPYNCYPSLAAWQANYGGIDFGPHPPGDLVVADVIAVGRIEGNWTQADGEPLELTGWVTDDTHYIRIYTAPEARHDGTAGSGYRLEITDPASRPLYSDVAYFRIEGLEFSANSAFDSSVIYLRPSTTEGVGEIHFSHNLIHGNGANSSSGIHNYDCRGTLKIWDNIIYDVGDPGYTAGIQTEAGTAYVYNNTIVDIISGFAIRAGGWVVAKNNLTEAPGDDFYGSYAPGSDFNASSDDTAPGFHSRRDQAFAFVDRGNQDFHLTAADAGARNYGTDLSIDPDLPISTDVDGDARTGGWDIGADEETTTPDDVPPVRLNGAPEGTLPAETTETPISLDSNEVATCRYTTTADVAYADMTDVFSLTDGLTHTHTVTGLTETQTYTYYVKCQDLAGNANSDDYAINFYIASSDAVPPLISDVQALHVTPYSADITWITDETCTSQVEYGLTPEYGHITVLSTSRIVSHSFPLLGLEPSTTYHFRVRSKDIAYNETVSGPFTFTTAALDSFYYVDQNHPAASDDNPGTIDLPWATIQHAADVAQAGDTIIVYPGTYGRVEMTHGGTPGSYITFKGASIPDQSLVDPGDLFDPSDPVQVPGNPELNAVTRGFELDPPYGVTETVAYVRIENFEITDIHEEGITGQGGFFLQDTEHVQIVRNFVHDLNPDPSSYGYIGIRGSGHGNLHVVVKENTLYRVQGTGISIVGRNWLVEGNELSHGLDANTDSGEHVGGDSDAMRFFGSNHVIRNNHAHDYLDEEQYGDPHIDCFQTFSVYPESQFAHHILIEGNLCDNFGQMLMIEDSSEDEGTGNKVHHITFRNNIFVNARAVGINGSRADRFTFVNNVMADGHYAGFGLVQSPYLTVLNNIFYHNGGGSQIIDHETKVGSIWDYNVHEPDFTWPPKQPEYDQHGMYGVDPRFVNPGTGDFYLRVDSPAIDQGIEVAEFNYDRDTTIRPQGATWDIGAYETTPAVVLTGAPADQAIHLHWAVNVTLPVTSTWRIDYEGPTGDEPSPITDVVSPTRSYTLTGLTNFTWYTVTLSAMLSDTALLSDTVQVMPTGYILYLPLVVKAYGGAAGKVLR
jgi:hypothetical protein